MHSCFFPRRRRQPLHSGGGGGVTVVSRGGGEGSVRAKIVVSGGELERIAAAVTRRQCQCSGAAPTRRHAVTAAVSLELEGQVPRSEPEEGGAGVAQSGDWDWWPALDGVPEKA